VVSGLAETRTDPQKMDGIGGRGRQSVFHSTGGRMIEMDPAGTWMDLQGVHGAHSAGGRHWWLVFHSSRGRNRMGPIGLAATSMNSNL